MRITTEGVRMSNVSLAPAVRSSKPFRILSNVQRLPESLPGGERLRHDFLPIGSRLFWNSWRAHVRSLFRDAIILHLPGKELFLLCLLRLLLPWSRARLIVVEAILPKPGTGRWARLSAWFKGLLLRRVDLFLLYQ